MRLLLFLLLGFASMASAETVQDLSQNNASPEEIIQKLNAPTIPHTPDVEVKEPVQVGRVVSLLRQSPDTPFYNFTIALSDDRVVTVYDANKLGLKPGDMVILKGEEAFWRIKSKVTR